MKASGPRRFGERLLLALSFSGELYRLRRELNARIDAPRLEGEADRGQGLGVTRWFGSRRVSIAEAYVRVVGDLDSRSAKSRLRALRRLVELSFHTRSLDMPLNTARVQLALVKEAVKNRGNRRRQLELLHDFSESSTGQYQVVRRLLEEHNMVELPETGRPLRELDAGWDGKVHDSSTSGRKNATQLLIDAFIKGLSELTLATGGPTARDHMAEALEAGRIVGIRVRLGIEFGLSNEGRRFHFMALLPELSRSSELDRFLRERRKNLRELAQGLEETQESRVESLKRLLAAFNEGWLAELNESYPRDARYQVPRLRLKDLARFVPLSRANRVHLGDFLLEILEPIYLNRVLLLKTWRARASGDPSVGREGSAELEKLEAAYAEARTRYTELNTEGLLRVFFSGPAAHDYQTAFDDLGRMSALLREAGCSLRLLHPLEHGLEAALDLLETGARQLDEVEIFNMQEGVRGRGEEGIALCRRLNELNTAALAEGRRPLLPRCGSDATGRRPEIPGMGFLFGDRLAGLSGSGLRGERALRRYAKRHRVLPREVALLLRGGGAVVDLEAARPPLLFSMGKIASQRPRRVGDEADDGAGTLSPRRALRYLNPVLLDLARVATGYLVARAFVGDAYALLWLGITAVRNAVADLIASRGMGFRRWTLRGINFDNVSRSLFWTGFSVPLLGFVKANFDGLWPFAAVGILHNAVKFFFLSGANGLYIATHNTIRGFDRSVVRANLFRSILSWPFATIFAPLGNLLLIPSIVQTKIWSDVVAGFIEGGSRYRKILALGERDLDGILPRLASKSRTERLGSLLDLLYLWREEPRTRNSLAHIFAGQAGAEKRGAENRGAGDGGGSTSFDPEATLLALLCDRRIERRLVDYILAEYPRQVAVELAGLVSGNLPELRAWVLSRSRP